MLEKKFPMNPHRNVIQFNRIQEKFTQINVNSWNKKIFIHVCH